MPATPRAAKWEAPIAAAASLGGSVVLVVSVLVGVGPVEMVLDTEVTVEWPV